MAARVVWTASLFLMAGLLVGSMGCRTAEPILPLAEAAASSESVRLNPGDLVQVNFPGASSMSTSERIRLDGHIAMPLLGDVQAAGKTPMELQADLRKLYEPHLQNREVVVILSSSAASIFVTGAVNHPGRISMERPLNLLDAIVEAGGFDPKRANVRRVTVLRKKADGTYSNKMFNLKPVLRGKNVTPYKLEPFDIVFVPEKIF